MSVELCARALTFAAILCSTLSTAGEPLEQLVPPIPARGPNPLERRASAPARALQRPTRPAADDFVYLDNGVVRLGVDVAIGGAIGWLSKSGSSENVINVFETGRYVSGSFWSGPDPFVYPLPPEQNLCATGPSAWRWNVDAAGSLYGDSGPRATVTNLTAVSATVVSSPIQWACHDVVAPATFTMDIALVGSAVEVNFTLVNARTDIGRLDQFASTQELPASFFRGDYCDLVLYNGSAPFTGDSALSHIGPMYPDFDTLPTERWAAFVSRAGDAVGVWAPHLTNLGAAHYVPLNGSDSCVGDAGTDAAGYLAPWTDEIIDANIVYSYEFALVLGSVDEVRAYATARHAAGDDLPALPHYVFGPTRARCTYLNGLVDSGWPVPADGVVLALDAVANGLGLIVGPHEAWSAADAPTIFVNASLPAGTTLALLFEQYGTPQPCDACGVASAPARGGGFEVFALDMASNPNFAGRIQRLVLRPTTQQLAPGSTGQLRSITAAKP